MRLSPYGDLYVDRNGQQYTTATFATDDDPWRGAIILSPALVENLREQDLLPLTEVIRFVYPQTRHRPRRNLLAALRRRVTS